HVFPSGVNLDAFPASFLRSPRGREGPQPVIGYVGGLHRHMDFELLTAAAQQRPNWSWVFVGPRRTSVGRLVDLGNVRLVGERPHREVAGWIAGFDVCL